MVMPCNEAVVVLCNEVVVMFRSAVLSADRGLQATCRCCLVTHRRHITMAQSVLSNKPVGTLNLFAGGYLNPFPPHPYPLPVATKAS